MTVKQLKRFPQQPLVTPQLPRCDADTSAAPGHAQNWRADHYGDPTRCSRDAVVELDGHNYCRIHGGFKALDMYLTGKLTRVVGTGPTSPGYTEIDATNLVEGRDLTQTTPPRDEAVHELLQSNLIAPGLYATSSVFARGRAAMAAETLTLLASAPDVYKRQVGIGVGVNAATANSGAIGGGAVISGNLCLLYTSRCV